MSHFVGPKMGNQQGTEQQSSEDHHTQLRSSSSNSADVDALRAGHLLRNNTRIEIFDITADERKRNRLSATNSTTTTTTTTAIRPRSAAATRPTKQSLVARALRNVIPSTKKKTAASAQIDESPAKECVVESCSRLTKRKDYLCALHAEEERAMSEYADASSNQLDLYEANVVGYDEKSERTPSSASTSGSSAGGRGGGSGGGGGGGGRGRGAVATSSFRRLSSAVDSAVEHLSSYTEYRINLLHWDFNTNELYEWKLKKRFSQFDK